MRLAEVVRVAMAAGILLSGSGCFLDEIDKSMANRPGQGAAAAPAATATPAGGGAAPKQVAKAKPGEPAAPSWWETATTLGSEESKSDIVACKLRGAVEFMLRDDCLARGGVSE